MISVVSSHWTPAIYKPCTYGTLKLCTEGLGWTGCKQEITERGLKMKDLVASALRLHFTSTWVPLSLSLSLALCRIRYVLLVGWWCTALCRSLWFVEDIWGRHSNAVTDCSDILIPSLPFPYLSHFPIFGHIQDFSLSFYLGFSVQPTAGFPSQLPQICVRCFQPDLPEITSHCWKISPSRNHPWQSILTHSSFKHEAFESGNSWQAARPEARLCPRGSQSSGWTQTHRQPPQSSDVFEYYPLRQIQLSYRGKYVSDRPNVWSILIFKMGVN